MNNTAKLHLTKNWVTALFVYYFIVFLFGNTVALIALVPKLVFDKVPSILSLAIAGSVGMSCLGSSIFYIRKLYKSCIRGDLAISGSSEWYLARLGTVIYYVARPLFATGFSLLVVIGLLSGFTLASRQVVELNKTFVYMTMFLSFYVGFLTGRFVKNLENSGNRVLSRVISTE